MKNFLICLITTIMCFTLVGCGTGENKENNGDNNQNNNNQNDNQNNNDSDTVAWPANQYTNLIPKPDGATIYDEKAIDNNYFVGHSIDLSDWTIAECKAYAEKLKEAGFTTPGTGASDVVVTDNANTYSFGAENSDGVYVTVGSSYNSGRISIQVTKE